MSGLMVLALVLGVVVLVVLALAALGAVTVRQIQHERTHGRTFTVSLPPDM